MKKSILTTLVFALGFSAFQACGPSQEEIKAKEQAKKDSLAQVESARNAQIEADRLAAQAESQRLAAIEAEKERRRIDFSKDGKYTVQVEASRGNDLAEKQVQVWKKRGFPDAYVVQFGNEATGEIWFRVRLGSFATKKMANKAANLVFEDYKLKAWVTTKS